MFKIEENGRPDKFQCQSAVEKNRCGDVEECCRDIVNMWLQNETEGEYPVTWQGLNELLEDHELSQLVMKLKQRISS